VTIGIQDHLHGHGHEHEHTHVHSAARFDIRHYIPSILLAGYGLFVISLYFRGVLTWYINPSYVFPAMLAAVVLLGLSVVLALRKQAVHCDTCCEDGCSCNASPSYRVYALLTVPLVLAMLVPPHALAAFSAHQRGPQIAGLGVIHGGSTVKRVSLSVDTRSFTMRDWVGALSADPNPADYKGKPVVVTGLVLHDSSAPKGYFTVIRYLVTCCIADARPVGLIVRDTSNGAIQDNQWVTVAGTMGSVSDSGQKIAVVIPKTVTKVKSGNPYIY
jgi:uncharacterized repeat protein (TIGR03943 family)